MWGTIHCSRFVLELLYVWRRPAFIGLSDGVVSMKIDFVTTTA